MYSRIPITRTFKGNRKRFEISGVRVIEGKISKKNDLKGNRKRFELAGARVTEGSSYRDSTVVLFPLTDDFRGNRATTVLLSTVCKAGYKTIL